MRELFKTHFALTDKGAKDLQKASAASFFVYVINFFPAMLLLLLVDELLLNNVKETGLYLWGSILVLAVMWILLRIEYDDMMRCITPLIRRARIFARRLQIF